MTEKNLVPFYSVLDGHCSTSDATTVTAGLAATYLRKKDARIGMFLENMLRDLEKRGVTRETVLEIATAYNEREFTPCV